jgi:hypothetical protein
MATVTNQYLVESNELTNFVGGQLSLQVKVNLVS